MRKLAIAAALASTMLASPALARDGSAYVGVEGGIMLVEDVGFNYTDATTSAEDAIVIDHERGFDVDVIGGYDFGMFRLEAEAAYKSAGIREMYFDPSADIVPAINSGINDANGRVRVLSAMGNALLDFGDEGLSGYAGAGLGLARVKYRAFTDIGNSGFSDTDNGVAWQLIAGLRFPLATNMDAGVKYRFFNVRRLNFDVGGAVPAELSSRFRSHSLLASLVFNFAQPVAPVPPMVVAPPPPPPPATQTCPDGSVILATDVCPAPPPPPPPPPPTEERG